MMPQQPPEAVFQTMSVTVCLCPQQKAVSVSFQPSLPIIIIRRDWVQIKQNDQTKKNTKLII